MALVRLALAAGQGSELARTRAIIAVDGRVQDAAYQRLDETVLVYLHVNGVVLDFVGQGTVASVGVASQGRRLVTLDPYAPFAAPVSGEVEREVPGVRRMLELDDKRVDEIVALSKIPSPLEAHEAALPAPAGATYAAIRDQVLRVWRHRCAFTGTVERPKARLSVVPIRPHNDGGPLHVSNYLPMVAELAEPWRNGHFSVGADYRILGDLYRLAPEEQDRMVSLFKMLLPDDPKDYPHPAHLAWHFAHVFGRS